MEGIIDKDILIDDMIKSFTCEENIYLLEPIVNQVKKFRPIPKLINPGEKVLIDNFVDVTDSNSELKLITNYSETETEIKVGGGLFEDNPIWKFVRGQKTVTGTMSIIERIFDDESISYDTKYHSSYLVFMKSFSDYLDWNGKTLNPVALKLFYEYINFLKIKGFYDKAIELQNFENSFLENVNYDFF